MGNRLLFGDFVSCLGFCLLKADFLGEGVCTLGAAISELSMCIDFVKEDLVLCIYFNLAVNFNATYKSNRKHMIFEFRDSLLAASLFVLVSTPPVSNIIDSLVRDNLRCSTPLAKILVKALLIFTLYYIVDKLVVEPMEIKRLRDHKPE